MPPRRNSLRLRTFGVVAHVDAGKTTLTERILHATRRIHSVGSVDDGTTATDFDPRERDRGITIGAAAVTASFRDHELTLVDTPGHVDFGVEVERSLRVLDSAIVVLDAVSGVEPQTEAAWARADRFGLPRVVFVNKIDRIGADFDAALASLESTFGVVAAPVVVVAPNGSLVDVVRSCLVLPGEASIDERAPLPEELQRLVKDGRERLVEACSAFDTGLVDMYLERGDVEEQRLLAALRLGTLEQKIVPVLAGSAKNGVGVSTLLDAVVDLLPSPTDRKDARGDDPVVAFCFKGVHDRFGQRSFVRVYAGTLRKGDSLVTSRGRRIRVGRLVRLFAGDVEDIELAGPGEIAALLGAPLETGETLCHPDHPFELEGLVVPRPVVSVAIEPRTADSRSKLGPAVRRLASDDPSLVVSADEETGETLLSGLGELHLEVTLDKLARDHGVEVRASNPRVAYRETVTGEATVEHRHIKQSGGPGQYAVVRLRVAPAPRGSGLSFEDQSEGGEIPRTFIPAVEAGVREAAARGVLAGYPVDDVNVTLLGGAFHSNDSSELAFSVAAKQAFAAAARAAGPVLLEPVMRLDVSVPEPNLGDVLGEIATRRGRVEDLSARGTARVVMARVPLAELLGWTSSLRSRTQGRGSASMALATYEVVPAAVMKRVNPA